MAGHLPCGNTCGTGFGCYKGACLEHGALRLMTSGGDGVSSGRLEVFHAGKWNTVTSGFDSTEAAVACRQLGFSSGTNTTTTYGSCTPSNECGQLYSWNCEGGEARLADCSFLTFSTTANGRRVVCTP